MSLNGQYTPLGLNLYGELIKNNVFSISPIATSYQGNWTPSACSQGSIVADSFLKKLTDSLPNFYNMTQSGSISVSLYRNLLSIGRPINIKTDNRINCPALGNSRPDTFKTSYAGYGDWSMNVTDSFGNVINTGSELKLVGEVYPPSNYGSEQTGSYIYKLFGSISKQDYQYDYQWRHEYAWVTGWPARSAFQKETDDYSAAYFPRPDIRSRDQNLIEYDEYFKNGFLSTVARQAYYELWSDHQTRRPNQYKELVKSFVQCSSWKDTTNQNIGSFVNSKTFLKGNFSNLNDLASADIAGINLAFKEFGNDLIRLGKSLNLSGIDKFGTPSTFLLNLQTVGALTDALKFVLLYNDLTTSELDNILSGKYVPTIDQEKKIYECMEYITGQDLENIKIILNCTTENLDSLSDLMNPIKMFPNSYPSLTVPHYDINNPVSKIYDFIYIGEGINPRIENWGDYLSNILPEELASACGAFMMSMCQIKNIKKMNLEQFSQVVANLEVLDKNLDLINNPNASPVNTDSVDAFLKNIAFGSGNRGIFRQCDFFGAASSVPYADYYNQIQNLFKLVDSEKLENIYTKLYQKSLNNGWALISRGKGHQDSVINQTPSWSSEYAYTVFKTVEVASAQTDTIKINLNLTQILSTNTKISFVSNGSTYYTVKQTQFDGVNTTVTLNESLQSDISENSIIYIEETEYENSIQNLIDAANLEIYRLFTNNNDLYNKINFYWDKIGKQLYTEQLAIPFAVKSNQELYAETSLTDFEIFVKNIENWAQKTQYGDIASVLEQISNTNSVGGQSLIALMRESRNAIRLMNIGGELDNSVPTELHMNQAAAEACEVDQSGGISSITVISGGRGYNNIAPPKVKIGPFGGVFGGSGSGATAAAIVENGSVTKINIISSGSNYSIENGCIPVNIDPPPRNPRLGTTNVPGSFAGSIYTGDFPVSDNLVSSNTASYTVNEAIGMVTTCNCDCWK